MFKNIFKYLFPISMIDDDKGGGDGGAGDGGAGDGGAGDGGAGDGGAGDGGAGDGGAGDGGAGEWHSGLPEDVRQWDEVTNSDSEEKFWGQMTNMRSHLGKSITIPDENASAADKAIFYDKVKSKAPGLMIRPDTGDTEAYNKIYDSLGRPETVEGYEYELPETPDGVKLDTAPIESFLPIAHKIGLNKSQFKETVEAMTAINIQAKQTELNAQAEDIAGLKTEWGSEYDAKTKSVLTMAEKMKAPEHVIKGIENGALDSSSIKWLYDVSLAVTGEGNPASREGDSGGFNQTPDQAKLEITKILNDREHPYHNGSAKGHKEAIERMRKLYMAADPENSRKSSVGGTVGVG